MNKISVLMSCHNGERWVSESVVSVLSQTHTNIEFIIVDDGSTDRTLEIVRRFAKSDSRIRIFCKSNTGLSDSLNYGLTKATCDWIARIDQDDISDPNRILSQIAYAMRQRDAVLIGGFAQEVDMNLKHIKTHRYPTEHRRLVENLESLGSFFPHSAAFFRRDLALKVGGYNPRLSMADDRRLWLDFALIGKIGCVPNFVVRIRKHSYQMSHHSQGDAQLRDALAATLCYFLVKDSNYDPSRLRDEGRWENFICWIDNYCYQNLVYQEDRDWRNFRNALLHARVNRVAFLKLLFAIKKGDSILRALNGRLNRGKLARKMYERWCAENDRS